jgi:hypothetical protein
MKQIYAPYTEWEDYKNGMYKTIKQSDEVIKSGALLLSNEKEFYNTAIELIENWVISTSINLTNNGINKKAWIGQASCCYKYGLTEESTRLAWGLLTDEQKNKANKVADKIIKLWTKQQYEKNQFRLECF